MIESLRKKQQTSIQEGHRAFHWKYYLKDHRQNKQIWLFSIMTSPSITLPWLIPQSEHNSYPFTFDSTVCKFASQMIFLHSSVLHECPWELVSHPTVILSCVQRTNSMRVISDKVGMILFSHLDRLERSPCSRILICIINFRPVWIWLNPFIQSQYFVTI